MAASEEDIDVVRDQFAAVNERDFARAMSRYAEDVSLFVDEDGPEPGSYEGKEVVGRWFGNWFQMFARDYHFDLEEARAIGDVVFIHVRHSGSGRASGVKVSGELSYLFEVREGKVSRVEIYGSRDRALELAASRG